MPIRFGYAGYGKKFCLLSAMVCISFDGDYVRPMNYVTIRIFGEFFNAWALSDRRNIREMFYGANIPGRRICGCFRDIFQ